MQETTLKQHYHTIIIGAGPAGLACALTLLKEGQSDVLVAEKFTFPRDKCCAGYITRKTQKAYARFGLDAEDCGYTLIRDFRLFFRGRCTQTIVNRFLFTSRQINRIALDDAFFRLAVSRGVQVAEHMPLTAHDPEKKTVTLSRAHTISYDNLIFADGTMSLGHADNARHDRNLAMQCIFPSDRPDGIDIHFGVTRRGYCWVSTFRSLTNVGMTDEFRKTEDYRKIFEDFLRDLGLNAGASPLYAAFTPIGVRTPVLGQNVFFAGDALGACDPFTLSGIHYALTSGEKAALAVVKSDPRILTGYARSLRVRFFFMRLLMKLFYIPWVRWLVFNVGCRFLSGTVTFFFNRFLNKK